MKLAVADLDRRVQRGSPHEGKERRTSGSLREENKVTSTEGTAVWRDREALARRNILIVYILIVSSMPHFHVPR